MTTFTIVQNVEIVKIDVDTYEFRCKSHGFTDGFTAGFEKI